MFCNQCGQNLPDNSLACFRCGIQFVRQVESIPNSAISKEDMYKAMLELQASQTKTQPAKPIIIKQSSGLGVVVFMTLIFGGLIVAGIIGLIAYKNYQDRKTIFGFEIRDDGVKIKIPEISQPQIQTQKQQATMQNDGNTNYCYLISKANVKIDCDSKDCDNDSSTVWGYGIEGDEINLTGNFVPSTNGYDWREVTGYKRKVFIASSKLDCKF